MLICPYLNFRGNCAAALKYYEQALGAKVVFQITYGASPAADQTPKEMREQIMHARFTVGENVLMASDCPPGRYDEPKGFVVAINLEDAQEADRIFAALAEKGKVSMPIQETFWAKRFGMLADQFGTPWMINCEKKS